MCAWYPQATACGDSRSCKPWLSGASVTQILLQLFVAYFPLLGSPRSNCGCSPNSAAILTPVNSLILRRFGQGFRQFQSQKSESIAVTELCPPRDFVCLEREPARGSLRRESSVLQSNRFQQPWWLNLSSTKILTFQSMSYLFNLNVTWQFTTTLGILYKYKVPNNT